MSANWSSPEWLRALLISRITLAQFDKSTRPHEGPKKEPSREVLLRGYGGVHPAILHHTMRRTKTEIVHMIGNVEPAVNDPRRDDQHVADLQLDFA